MTTYRACCGTPITEGLIAFDNNLDLVRVGELHYSERNENTGTVANWFRVFDPMTGKRDGAMDESRLTTRFNGEYALDRLRAAYAEIADADRDAPWEIDHRLDCGGCGAQWTEIPGSSDGPWTGDSMEHAEGCPWLAATQHRFSYIAFMEGWNSATGAQRMRMYRDGVR